MDHETTIHLTDRPPVQIRAAEWPVIAKCWWGNGDTTETSTERAYVKVRAHADGRAIVYGLRAAPGRPEQLVGYLVPAQSDIAVLLDAVRNACALVGLEPQAVFDDMTPELL